MLIELIWLFLLLVTIVPFGLYILYMSGVAKKRPWNIKIDETYEPSISIVIPTYNEEGIITRKLENVAQIDYPVQKIELIVVDSASRDNTVQLVEEWGKKHENIKLKMIQQSTRRGLVNAIIEGLGVATGEIFIKTDADCMLYPDSIKKALKYLPDPSVGSVAGHHVIVSKKETLSVKSEKTYREFYALLRIGESKLFGTVLYEGELMLLKRDLITSIGFDKEVGGDDVATALRLAANGYRAITAEDSFFIEQTPYTWAEKFNQKIRRGRHVSQALWKYKFLINRKRTIFHSLILPFETFIYLINPFFVFSLMLISILLAILHPWLLLFGIFLVIPQIRQLLLTFMTSNWIMIIAIVLEIRSREKLTWQKSEEIRE